MATASPWIVRMRNFFVGRNLAVSYNNRLPENQSPRSIPTPNLPDGVSHRINNNPYCLRDGRRFSQPPTMVYSTTKQLAEPKGAEGDKSVATSKKPPVLGILPECHLSKDEPYLHL
ncbi:NADH dehydrogenase [ubiquinone] 1 alpha subcomplex subunit 7-like [Amphiura filiformis]|uniref:NADH dehydrogenase [ubiquinone] 1 alpha subcomplex subunit 7-like n=1 Tax=Amphiura filiformis TaxID=82378 RepID=UPI003B210251